MTPERWQQVQTLLDAALAMPVESRPRFVAKACAGDAELQIEVESLLAQAVTGFLSVPAVAVRDIVQQDVNLIGRQVGPYTIKSRLGAGGMGDVYLAEDTRLHRFVAIKSLREPGPPSREGRARLLREARAVAALNHPNIAAIYDIIEATGDPTTPPYIVMEYVEGETLSDRLRSGPLATADALRIAKDVADALVAAHSRGVVHRDLKPANLRVNKEKRVKILDFGLARRLEVTGDTSTMTAEHMSEAFPARIAGTPGYMSPEQVLGRPVGPASDVFSLGVVLFEMLTGKRPFSGGDFVSTAEAMLTRPVPRVVDVAGDIAPTIDALVARMLSLDAAKRPTAPDVFAALDGLAPASLPDLHPLRTLTGSRSAMTVVGVVLTAIVIVAGAMWWRSSSPGAPAVRPSIAVLPLANLSGDATKDYLGIGIAEALTTSLAHVSAVSVISRTSMADAPRNGDVRTIARDVGATLVLQGSVQQSGDRLRVNAKLVRPDGSVSWAGDAEASSADLFALEKQLAAAVIEGLSVPVSAAERQTASAPPTRNDAALEAYWRGLAFMERSDPGGSNAATVGLAVASFERATLLDPRFAAAFGALGESYRREYRATGDAAWIAKASAAISRGLAIDPDQPDVRISLGGLYTETGRGTEAITAFRDVLARHPDNDEAHRGLAVAFRRLGQTQNAITEYQAAVNLRPEYWRNHQELALFFYDQNRWPEAIAAFTRVIEIRPNDANAYLQRGAALQSSGQRARAKADYDRSIALEPNAAVYSNLGSLAYSEKRYKDAADAYMAAITLRPKGALYHRNLGDAYLRLNRTAEARAEYLKAISLNEDRLRVNPNDTTALSQLAVNEAKAGRAPEARRHADDDRVRNATSPDVLFRRAVTFALIGDKPAALAALKDAVSHGYGVEQIQAEDDLAALREMPAFRDLIRSKR